jgi:hypothetical protein
MVCALCCWFSRRAPTTSSSSSPWWPAGAAGDVLYVVSLTGVQFAHLKMSGLMTGLFFTGPLGGVTLDALAVGGLFDAVGVSWALATRGVAIALSAAWAARPPTADTSHRALEADPDSIPGVSRSQAVRSRDLARVSTAGAV